MQTKSVSINVVPAVPVAEAESAAASALPNMSTAASMESTSQPLSALVDGGLNTDVYHCEADIPSLVPKRTEKEEEADRVEAEMDEMSRWMGPVAKSLFTPVVSSMVDANSFADALGVSPLYKQKETQRWSSALHVYRQMSSSSTHEQSSAQHHQKKRLSEDEELAELCLQTPTDGDHAHGDFDDIRPAAPPPRDVLLAPIPVPAHTRPQNGNSQAAKPAPTSQSGVPSYATTRKGFMTPPATMAWMSAGYIVSPPHRKSSSVSPGESSLNSLELEAIAAVHELQFAVKDMYVSEILPRTSELIFLNLTTLEGQAYCVELTVKGWRVTSLRHDCMNGDINHLDLHVQYFETIYALMDRISPGYRRRFTDALVMKLSAIEAEQGGDVGDTDERNEASNSSDPSDASSEERLEQERRQTFT